MTPKLAPIVAGLALTLGWTEIAPALARPAHLFGASEDPLGGEDVSEALEAIRAKNGVPGMVAMAIQDGEVLAWGAAGVRAQGAEDSVTIADPFHLGSCTKSMTSTLVAICVEEGLVEWDATIFEVLPELEETSDPGYASATLENLVQHRAGIAERQRPEVASIIARFATLEGTLPEQRLAVARMALETAPHTKPGEAMDYSNYGYMTAAAMIERKTGKAWEELIVEKLLVPLEMQSAGVGSPAGEGVPVGHQPFGESWAPLAPGPGGVLPDSMAPAGLLHSNLHDWGKFVSAHLAGARGEDGIIPAEAFQRLQQDPAANAYAAGWSIGTRSWGWGEGSTLSHNGSDGTWYSKVTAMPEWDLIVLTAVNCAGNSGPQAGESAEEHLMGVAGFVE